MDFPSWWTLAGIAGVLLLAVELGIRVVALGVIPGGRRPSSGMAWLLLILAAPILGFAIFLFLGRTHLGRKRHDRQRAVLDRVREVVPIADVTLAAPGTIGYLNQELGGFPLVAGNTVELLPGYDESLARMAEAVDTATTYVHCEFYISVLDEVTQPLFDALARAAARGVVVKVLFDHLASRGFPTAKELLEFLESSGIDYHRMLPLEPLKGRWRRPDLRNHRKLLVVDGRVAFTGSQNLTEPSYHNEKHRKVGRKWTELMVRLHGPVVTQLDAVFAGDWYTESHEISELVPPPAPQPGGAAAQVVPSGPGVVAESNLRMFTTLIYSAERRISLTSPYFVPDESLLYAVTTAAHRGVDVELFVSEESDQFMVGHAQASYYRALLEAGIRIYLYPPPAVLHSKHFTVDDETSVIGSSNMDMRSFALNYEVSLMVADRAVTTALREVEDTYRALSRELTLDEWSQRSRRLKYVDNLMRLTSSLQ